MIGNLKHRVTLSRTVLVSDGAGGFSESREDIATVHAAIMPVMARQQLKFGQIMATVTHEIVIRKRADILPGMFLTDGEDVTYSVISSAARNGAGDYLTLLALVRPC
jgi:SPP1 family predicted phage head-tail adaptor